MYLNKMPHTNGSDKNKKKKERQRKIKSHLQVQGQMGEGHSKVSKTQGWGQGHSMVTDERENMQPQTFGKS